MNINTDDRKSFENNSVEFEIAEDLFFQYSTSIVMNYTNIHTLIEVSKSEILSHSSSRIIQSHLPYHYH